MRHSILLVMIILSTITFVSANPYSFNLYGDPTGNITNIFQNITVGGNTTNHSNFTDYWITDIGPADTINATQFDLNGDTLTIDESWLTTFGNKLWCALTGCTMTGNINMSGNNITNVGTITADFLVGDGSGLTNISGATGDNNFHTYINGSAYNNINYNITAGDVNDVEFLIEPGKKFIFGDTYT